MDGLFGMLRGIGGKTAGGDGAGALLPTVPAGRNFYAQIEPPAGNTAVAAGLDGAAFVPGQCYFSVRLVEMRLCEAGNYLSQFLP
ncbi:MAG: hypothetical protein ACTHLV_09470, partial [Achromobacter mucicolens]